MSGYKKRCLERSLYSFQSFGSRSFGPAFSPPSCAFPGFSGVVGLGGSRGDQGPENLVRLGDRWGYGFFAPAFRFRLDDDDFNSFLDLAGLRVRGFSGGLLKLWGRPLAGAASRRVHIPNTPYRTTSPQPTSLVPPRLQPLSSDYSIIHSSPPQT